MQTQIHLIVPMKLSKEGKRVVLSANKALALNWWKGLEPVTKISLKTKHLKDGDLFFYNTLADFQILEIYDKWKQEQRH